MHIPVKDLTPALQQALRAVGYGAHDVSVEAREQISPAVAGGDGQRGFLMLVDLHTGKHQLHQGSWGGANIFNQGNSVDLDLQGYALPANGAAIKGTTGHPRTFATVYVHPDQLKDMLPTQQVELTNNEQVLLNMFSGLTSAGRKDELARMNVRPRQYEPVIDSLVAKGLLKRNKAGAVSVTTEGKNAVSSRFGNFGRWEK